jgi:undecaprenyl-diphosphatase
MFAVTCYSLFLKDWTYKGIHQTGIDMILYSPQNTQFFIVGNIIAFLIAALAIKFFLGFLHKYGFKVWGWYRVLIGCSLLIYFLR